MKGMWCSSPRFATAEENGDVVRTGNSASNRSVPIASGQRAGQAERAHPVPPRLQGYVVKDKASIRRLLVASTSSLQAQRKSAPRIGGDTVAITKSQPKPPHTCCCRSVWACRWRRPFVSPGRSARWSTR